VGRAVEEAARRLQEVLSRALSRSIARERALLGRLDREEESLSDAADLRRAGESLLAGLTQATPVEGGVEVPDPWSTEPRRLFIAVDPRFDLAGNVDRYFRRARRIDRSRQALEKRREEVRNRIESLETLEVGLDGTRQLEDLELLRRELEEAGVVKAQVRRRAEPSRHVEPLRFPTPEGGVILVGRSARSNEALTFQVARPGDLWFHAAQVPGAHVVLRGGDDEVEVTRAAAAAAFFSKARAATSVEVIYTARRNVARAKGGPPGLVRVNRFKSIRVRPEAPPAVGSSLSDVSSRKNRGGDGA
jgi:predicted ribosome quality control (RQC) complex YloA/Tae2 family protein